MSIPTLDIPVVSDYLGVLRRRYGYVVTILPAAVLLCVIAAYGIPPQYQATATIMLEPSSVPKDIIETTVLSYSDQQIEIVQSRVMTVNSMLPIVKDIDPYPERKNLSAVEKAQRLLDDTSLERVDAVSLKPQAESNAFSLHYNNRDPLRAKEIDERLAQLFLKYNQLRRTQAAGDAAGFLQKQAEKISQQMSDVDGKLAILKAKYGEGLPEYLARNQGSMEDLQRQGDILQQQILTQQEKESVLSLQLSQMSPNLIAQSGDLTDVATVRAKLTDAEQRYTPDHPEVKRLRRALQSLMAQPSVSTHGIAGSANNPQYNLTATELQSARNQLANLQSQANNVRAKLAQHRNWVSMTPTAEREISEVLRRKQVLQNEYQQTQDRLQSASLAETFESQQGGERFALLRAPFTPRSPVYPNRVGLILLGLAFGVALSGIAVAVAESMDHNVRTARDLPFLDGVPVLSSIPFIKNRHDQRRHAVRLGSVMVAYSIGLSIAIAVIIFSRNR